MVYALNHEEAVLPKRLGRGRARQGNNRTGIGEGRRAIAGRRNDPASQHAG